MKKAILNNIEFGIGIAFAIALATAVVYCASTYGYHNPIAS